MRGDPTKTIAMNRLLNFLGATSILLGVFLILYVTVIVPLNPNMTFFMTPENRYEDPDYVYIYPAGLGTLNVAATLILVGFIPFAGKVADVLSRP